MGSPKAVFAGFHHKVLMDDMMEVVGVDILEMVDIDGGQSYLRARANCCACADKSACRDWLAAHSEGEPQAFCPNAELFRQIKRGDA